MISALKNNGVSDIKDHLLSQAIPGAWTHHASLDSELSPLEIVEEAIREKILCRTNKEVPYSTVQENFSWVETETAIYITQNLFVPRIGQKYILLGENGTQIQWIRDQAALDISKRLGKAVNLKIDVKIKEERQ